MKYFIVAGERSGDLHASKLVEQLKRLDVRAEFTGFGGDYLKKAGMKILRHYSSYSFMGIVEVITNLNKIRKMFKNAKEQIKLTCPDVLILVDFPGMNLKLGSFAQKRGIKVCYYISPKIWAWKSYRIRRIKRDVDRMLVILPFEVSYYQSRNYNVTYVGNPLIDAIRDHEWTPNFKLDTSKINIAVLPGSRKQEIKASTKIIADLSKKASNCFFHIAAVDNVDEGLYKEYANIPNTEVHINKTYELLQQSNVAIVTSGTATLEAALLNCPQMVVYRANPLSIFIVRLLIKIKWISLVNLIAEKQVVKEFIQKHYNVKNVMKEIHLILNDHSYCASMMADYQMLRDKIGTEKASKRAAYAIKEWLNSQ